MPTVGVRQYEGADSHHYYYHLQSRWTGSRGIKRQSNVSGNDGEWQANAHAQEIGIICACAERMQRRGIIAPFGQALQL